MHSQVIRQRFLDFFKKRHHVVIPSASLVPEHDPSVLFTTAGMQPLVPYLLGEKHPQGDKLVNVQKCVRMQDIEEVGDATHDTFFEMLGNWSLGAYFKEEAIRWSYEFLTSKEEGLGLHPGRLYITCFSGDKNAPKDTESANVWKSLGIPENRIYFLGKSENWWSPGESGPSGPDTEMFYDVTKEGVGDLTEEAFLCACDEQKIIEIWNDVFMEYNQEGGKVTGKLLQKNVDTGAGLERLAMVLQGKDNIFDTDLFEEIMAKIEERAASFSGVRAHTEKRIVADHIRTAVFITADGVSPSNTDRGYVVRRLIRRAVRYGSVLRIRSDALSSLIDAVIEKYASVYPNLKEKKQDIHREIHEEALRFEKTLAQGLKEFERIQENPISGKTAFDLYQNFGFPVEMTVELARERGVLVDEEGFRRAFKEHQTLSRKGAEQKFKGGLADEGEMSVKYHTATHLLHKALRDVLGEHVLQKGSNITRERLRFDFNFERKMTDEEVKRVEALVNQKIQDALPVTYEDIPLKEAEKRGAIGLFEEKYGDRVRVYKIGDFSLEFCGGPHVKNTKELGGVFKVIKEEAVAKGVRRIKAVLMEESKEEVAKE